MLPKQRERRSFGRLRQRSSGRWQAGYTGPNGGTYLAPQTFDAKDDAVAWLSAERRMVELGEWLPPDERTARRKRDRTTFGDFAATWLDTRVIRGQALKPRTRAHYQSLLDRFILPTFSTRLVATITAEDVDAWYATTCKDRPTYRAHSYSLLRTILASAVEKRMLAANPAHIRGAGSTVRTHKVEPLSLDELTTLVEAMPENRRLMVLLAAWCALRFGELAELRRGDVDLTNGVVKVRRGVVRVDGQAIVGAPKSAAGTRDVAIPPHLMPLVKAHLKAHADAGRDALLFPAASGGHLAPSTFYGVAPTKLGKGKNIEWRGGHGFYRARAVAGRPDLHFHDLRHTGAVLAALTGATLAELMGRLGHSTPGAALRYQHVARDRDKAIAAALSRMVT